MSVSNRETEELLERVEERKKNSGFKYVYQNGLMYLHPLNYEMLLKDYEDVMNLPLSIKAEVLEIEEHLTGSSHKQGIYFQHLPLGAKVLLVEVNLKKHLTHDTYKLYEQKLKE